MPSRRQQAACKSCAMACAGRARRAAHGGMGRLRPILLVLMLHGGGGAVGAVAAAGAGTSVPALRISGGGLPGYSMLTDESVSLRRGIGRIPQPSDLVPPAVFVDVPAVPPSDLAPPAASMDSASPPPPPPSPPPPPADPPRQSAAPLTPAPPAAPPPKSKIVLPEVSAPGSVRDVLGWAFAFLTCSPAARRQQKLNERLWVAAARGDAEACQEMLGKGADVHAASHDGGEDPRLYFSDLYGLAFYEDQEKALEAGARPAHETAKPATKPPKRLGAPRTALGWAAYNGQAAAADLMLRAGADPEAADSEGYTPLHEAALYGHIEVVRVLLSHGASVNARTEER